jgi:hypothetical protein
MKEARFQLIVGETKSGRLLRKMLPISYGLGGAFLLCACVPALRFLLPGVGACWLSLLGVVGVIELSKTKLYELAGMIKLAEDGISFDGPFIPVANLQQVVVKFSTPRGQGIGRNGIAAKGNRIIIRTKDGEEGTAIVLIEAKAQRDNLSAVLRGWKDGGIIVSTDGLDLIPY